MTELSLVHISLFIQSGMLDAEKTMSFGNDCANVEWVEKDLDVTSVIVTILTSPWAHSR